MKLLSFIFPARETVFDRVEHVVPGIKEVPEIASLCDALPGLTKRYITLRDNVIPYALFNQILVFAKTL